MVIPAGDGAQRDRSPAPTGLLWAPAPAPAQQQRGRVCPPLPTHSLLRRKRLPGEGTLGGTYLLLPFQHTPALSLPDSGREIQVPSETRPNMTAQAARTHVCACARTHTHTHPHTELSLEDGTQQEEGWTRAQVRARGGFLSLPQARAHHSQVETRTHTHICSTD